MKNFIRLHWIALCISILSYHYTYTIPPVALKELAADSVLDNILLEEQDSQKVQQILAKLPEDVHSIIRERLLTRYRPLLFSALSIKTVPYKSLRGHTGEIRAVAFSLDVTQALTYSADRTARLWDLATGKTIKILEGHTENVASVAISPDRTRAVTGLMDGTVCLWDLATGKTIRALSITHQPIWSVAISPDGTQALSGSHDGRVYLWDLNTGEVIKKLHLDSIAHDSIASVAFSPDGTQALTGSRKGIVCLWDLQTGRALQILNHLGWISSVSVNRDGIQALIVAHKRIVYLWDISADIPKLIGKLNLHDRQDRQALVTDSGDVLAVSPNGMQALITHSRKVYLWDLRMARAIVTLEGHTNNAETFAAFSPDSKYALTTSVNGTVYLWDLEYKIRDLTLEQLLAALRSCQTERQRLCSIQ